MEPYDFPSKKHDIFIVETGIYKQSQKTEHAENHASFPCLFHLFPPLFRALQPYRQDHVQKVLLSLRRHDDSRGDAGIQLNFHRVSGRIPQGFHQISVIKAYLQTIAITGKAAHILGFSVAGLGGQQHFIMVENTPHRAFQLIGDHYGNTVNTANQRFGIGNNRNGVFLGIAFL